MPEALGELQEAALEACHAAELRRPASDDAQRLAAAIQRRHGESVAAILFYGSCLRRDESEGVFDFFVLVESYRTAYRSHWLALANALLPPNVFYLEVPSPQGPLRAKYAVFSLRDLERGTGLAFPYSFLWARLCQPSRLLYARDEAAGAAVRDAVVRSTLTLVSRMAARMPSRAGRARFSAAELWELAFRETYQAEWRFERPETIRSLYAWASGFYESVTRAALAGLAREGRFRVTESGGGFVVAMAPSVSWRLRRGWALCRLLSKILSVPRLLKSAVTFGDWVPYVLWKIERHRGIRIETTPRQRRHPFVWGWPIFLRLLLRRELR